MRRRSIPWTSQPTNRPAINLSVWPGRSQVVLPSLGYKCVIGGDETLTGANANAPFSWVRSQGRVIAQRPNTSTQPGEFFTWNAGNFDVGSNASMVCIIAHTNFGEDSRAAISYGGQSWGLYVGTSNSTTMLARYVDNPTSAEYGPDATITTLASQEFFAVGMTKLGNTVKLFYRGAVWSASGGNGGIRRSAGSGLHAGFGRNTTYTQCALAAVSSVVLPDAAMIELTRTVSSPWRIFAQRQIIIPYEGAAPSIPTLTAISASNISATGATLTITAS